MNYQLAPVPYGEPVVTARKGVFALRCIGAAVRENLASWISQFAHIIAFSLMSLFLVVYRDSSTAKLLFATIVSVYALRGICADFLVKRELLVSPRQQSNGITPTRKGFDAVEQVHPSAKPETTVAKDTATALQAKVTTRQASGKTLVQEMQEKERDYDYKPLLVEYKGPSDDDFDITMY